MGQLFVTTPDDGPQGTPSWGERAQKWFNTRWAKGAEFRANLHWGELLQLVVSSISN
jgi:hypothetical protein